MILSQERRRLIEPYRSKGLARLPAPAFEPSPDRTDRLQLALKSFQRHMTSESWQLQLGLWMAGYYPVGRGFSASLTDVRQILRNHWPGTVFVADKREWDPARPGCFCKSAQFTNTELLADRPEIFRLTLIKDAHQDPHYHRQAHQQIGAHAWVTPYHPDVITYLCPWVRPEHLLRTYHPINYREVPTFCTTRVDAAILSGAMGQRIYPLRTRLRDAIQAGKLTQIDWLPHPGYGIAKGCQSSAYLSQLAPYKVAICTSSIFAYALRKLIEATVAGCHVITDLPEGERLPIVEENLTRVPLDSSPRQIQELVRHEAARWDLHRQRDLAKRAVEYYDWRRLYTHLAQQIEDLRSNYNERAGIALAEHSQT